AHPQPLSLVSDVTVEFGERDVGFFQQRSETVEMRARAIRQGEVMASAHLVETAVRCLGKCGARHVEFRELSPRHDPEHEPIVMIEVVKSTQIALNNNKAV